MSFFEFKVFASWNLVSYLNFYDLVGELYDDLSDSYREIIDAKLNEGSGTDDGTKEGGFYSSFSQLL